MKGATVAAAPGDIEVKALQAGNDILLMPDNVPLALKTIKDALKEGKLSQEAVDESCRKVLVWKYKAGLHRKQKVELKGLYHDLNTDRAEWINRKLCEAAVTLVKNDSALLPLRRPDTLNIASVSIGNATKTPFQEVLDLYTGVQHFQLKRDFSDAELQAIIGRLKPFNLVLIGLHSNNHTPANNFGVTPNMVKSSKSSSANKNPQCWLCSPIPMPWGV
jgi:beta-N-acetylhexosaminidase